MDSLRNAVVVGGRGVIGSAIVTALRQRNWTVTVVTHDPNLGRRSGYRYGDMLDPTTLKPALEGADLVVQSANFPGYPFEKPRRRHTFDEFDGVGTERLINAAQAVGVVRYLFISGVGVTDDSVKPYYRALHRGEAAVTGSGLEGVVLRPAFVFGPNDNGINKILRACRRWLPALPLPDGGRQLHQPVFAGDVGSAAAQLCEPLAPTGTFEIGGPERMTMLEMLRLAFRIAGLRRPIVPVPVPLAKLGATVLEPLPGPLLTRSALDFVLEDFVADNSRLMQWADLELTRLEPGLQRYIGK